VKAPFQMLFINWLTKVVNDPIVLGAVAFNIIGVGSHEIVGIARPASLRCR
jgi:hypothetical protein